ncbi:uncharacterized protein LOC113280701 [Papaver somniferum]|uniref:uncharacterized protein LOC113280701 n=1 Tax=Papaver somniferum TaxID=3469 RepID=UPI000E6FA975|nr:uncharacterized protein LOC113280701 [Papaver somniferum]
MAELRAIREGITLVHKLGHKNVYVESDSTYIITLCQGMTRVPWFFVNILADIRFLVSQLGNVMFVQKYREGNEAADILAKKAANEAICDEWLFNPPAFLNAVLKKDAWGRAFPRFVKHSDVDIVMRFRR